MRKVLIIPLFLIRFVISIIKSGLNERNILQLVLNFLLNFSPVAIWLAIFKNAGRIPKEIRPKIYVRWAYDMDLKIFDKAWFGYWCLISIVFGFIWYQLVVRFSNYYNDPITSLLKLDEEAAPIEMTNSPLISATKKSYYETDDNTSIDDVDFDNDTTYVSSSVSSSSNDSSDDSAYSTDDDESLLINNNNNRVPSSELNSEIIPFSVSKITRRHSLYLIPILFFLIWPMLNIDHYYAQGLKTSKDLTAWFFYVLGHITFPILTAVWLYVFHQQGAVKCFSISLGTQNILGVITHLSFPNAPPWFIHLYGPDADANYDMPGYAAGLTRVDTALGTHLHSNGFHKSPIVFGALPSLHSAMAFQVCLYIYYYGCSRILRVAGIAFVCIQWWATIYLDHHFRVDLIVGVLYALFAFGITYPYILKKEKDFIMARLNGNFAKGSTMGMRVFAKNKRVQKFFDPYR